MFFLFGARPVSVGVQVVAVNSVGADIRAAPPSSLAQDDATMGWPSPGWIAAEPHLWKAC